MSTTKKYYGNYLGIVLQNNDPEKRGRVKVYVPHIAAAIYENWNKDFTSLDDKQFVFPDGTLNPDLDKIIGYLKEVLPWAEQASPIFGGSASGRYNAFTKIGSTSDSNYWEGNNLQKGFRPIQNYIGDNKLTDAFSSTKTSRFVNPNAAQYSPSDYSNLARGEFTIPNVGAHVWIFFTEGDPSFPVVWATSFGQEDWKRIYTLNKKTEDIKDFVSTDYPGAYENLAKDEKTSSIDHNDKTFRSKHVFNSNKHTIEFIDTDLAEILKFTHYSGSFLEFNNATTSRLATNNDQTMVLGDQYLTIQKNQAIYVAHHQETIINGDRFLKLGQFEERRVITKQILEILRDTHQYKRLFEIQRSVHVPLHNSLLQIQNGVPASCPVCGGSGDKFGAACITCGGSGLSPSSQWGQWLPDPMKFNDLIIKVRENQKKITDLKLEALFGNGGDDIVTITGNQVITIGTVFNDLESYRLDPTGKIRNEGTHIAPEGTYVSMCECPMLEYVDTDSPPGGDVDIIISNKYRLNVGSKGIHIKTTGPMDLYGTIMNISAEGLYITGKQELILEGSKRVEIRGDVINLKPHKGMRSEVLIDGNAGVAANLTVVGGTHIEGELYYLHQTAPKEIGLTGIGYGPVPHAHTYEHPPWTLLADCKAVRTAAKQLNEAMPAANMKCRGAWVPG